VVTVLPGVHVMPRKICEWSEIEPGSNIFNTCKEGDEFYLNEGMDLWPFCHWCGLKIEVTAIDGEVNG
jgi:hypothetical protein